MLNSFPKRAVPFSLLLSESVLFACTFANIGYYLNKENKQTKLVILLRQVVVFLLSSSFLWTWSQIPKHVSYLPFVHLLDLVYLLTSDSTGLGIFILSWDLRPSGISNSAFL